MVITEKNIIGNLVGTWAELTELKAGALVLAARFIAENRSFDQVAAATQ